MSQASRYCFTINNYAEGDIIQVDELSILPNCVYLIYGKETGENGNPHLQGFFILKAPQRFSWVKRRLPRAHIEAARGTSESAALYCKKEGDFKEIGVFPANKGKRTDLDKAILWADKFIAENGRPPSFNELAIHQPNIATKFPRFINVVRARAPTAVLQEGQVNQWQNALEERLNGPADDRKILFYSDPEGSKGKSWFQRYYYTKYPGRSQLFTFGKRDDTAYMIDESCYVFFFNIPRTAMEHLNYHLLEQIKDRVVQSNKYESRVKVFTHNTHVVVFSNEYPDLTKMTQDRFDIIDF